MDEILMTSAKLTTLGVLKRKILLNKTDNVLISVYHVTNKVLSRGSNYIVDMAMWLKFANFSISMKKVLWTQFYKDLTRKTIFWGVVLTQVH